jgi:hypothetical protein
MQRKPKWAGKKYGFGWAWSKREKAYIRKRAGRDSLASIAQYLGRSVSTVQYCATEVLKISLRVSRLIEYECTGCGKQDVKLLGPYIRAKTHYCSRQCRTAYRKDNSKGCISRGYRVIRVHGKTVHEHRHMMAQYLGRPLTKVERVHHKNLQRADNRIGNFELRHVSNNGAGHSVKECIEYLKFIGCGVTVPANIQQVW